MTSRPEMEPVPLTGHHRAILLIFVSLLLHKQY
jgi:hypothetical protein